MRFAARVLFLLCFALLLAPVYAADVLFIGNSFTIGSAAPVVERNGGVPKLFEEIAVAKGKTVDIEAVVAGGVDWSWHLAQPATAQALAARPWDWVILQDQSTRPTHMGDIPRFLNDGESFSDRITAAAPHPGIILFETWARPPGAFYNGTPGHGFSDPAQMMADLHDSYGRLEALLVGRHPDRETRVALIGTAFLRAGEEYPAINLNASDHHHATAEGYYLAALVIYETIYHESVKGAPVEFFQGALKFAPDTAADLQQVADEVAK